MLALETKPTRGAVSAGYSLSDASMLHVSECDTTPKQIAITNNRTEQLTMRFGNIPFHLHPLVRGLLLLLLLLVVGCDQGGQLTAAAGRAARPTVSRWARAAGGDR